MLFYNATAFEPLGVALPTTWAEFEAAARLTTRQTEGYIHVSTAFILEMLVSTRGGSVVTEAGQLNFDNPEAVDALSMLKRIIDMGNGTVRSSTELDVESVRTKGMMAFASIAPWGQRYSVAFGAAVAPVPTGERRGAVTFWQFLMELEQVTWLKTSYYLPTRRTALPLLEL